MESASKPHGSTSNTVVSLRQVAEAAGVSRMTVSRAFKPDASVRPELRERILKVASELGYEPDRLVAELMTSFVKRRPVKYRETIGVLWWEERWTDQNNVLVFGTSVRRGTEIGAEGHGCGVEHLVLTKQPNVRSMMRMLDARGIHGLIITPPPTAGLSAPDLDWSRFSAVSIGTSLRKPRLHRAQVAHYSAMVQMLETLRARGYRRPCLLLRLDLEERMQRAYAAAFQIWQADGEARVWHDSVPESVGLAKWLAKIRPDVVIGETDLWWDVLPERFASKAFVSMAVVDPAGDISGHHQNITRVAEAVVDLLIQARLRHETGVSSEPLIMLTAGHWIEGRTLKA